MRESTEQPYIDAHDAAWQVYMDEATRRARRGLPMASNWEAFTAGFAAGIDYGRSTPQGGDPDAGRG